MANNKNLKPFRKGDPRINRRGRPKNLDVMRQVAHDLCYEPADLSTDEVARTRLEQILREVEVECLPADLPEQLIVDVSALAIGGSIKVSGLKVPAGVRIMDDPDLILFTVPMPKEEKAEETAPAEGGGAEGAPAGGEAKAEGEEKEGAKEKDGAKPEASGGAKGEEKAGPKGKGRE